MFLLWVSRRGGCRRPSNPDRGTGSSSAIRGGLIGAGIVFYGAAALALSTPFEALCWTGVLLPLVALGVIGRVMQNRDERRQYVEPPPLVPKRPPPPDRPQSYWSNRR